MLRGQDKALPSGSFPKLFVPAREIQFLAGGEREGASQVDSVVSAERMRTSCLGSVR